MGRRCVAGQTAVATCVSAAHLDDLLVCLLREDPLIHADVTKLVLDDGEAETVVRILEDVIEQRGLAGAEEAGEDRDRYLRRS